MIEDENSHESQKIELNEIDTISLRQYSIEKALSAVKIFDEIDLDGGEDYGNLIVTIADKIENYVLEGKKDNQ